MPLGIDYVRIDLVDTITLNEPCARLIYLLMLLANRSKETANNII